VLVLGLLAWAPLFPGLALLVAGWAALRTPPGGAIRATPTAAWVARGLLTVVFLLAVADLTRDYVALT